MLYVYSQRMKTLESIWQEQTYQRELSYTQHLALMLQPASFADFGIHADFPEAFARWTREDSFRGLDIVRVWSLLLNLKRVLSRSPGAVAELGVYKGQCSALLSFIAEKFDRKMYLLDTFTGFAQAQIEEELSETSKVAFRDISLEAAQRVVGDYAGNHWIVGMFPDSATDELRSESFAFVSLDCDLYEPIIQGLNFFWPRLAPGGMIFVHDYGSGHWPGATKAVDEFCDANGLSPVLLPDMAGSVVLTRGCGQS